MAVTNPVHVNAVILLRRGVALGSAPGLRRRFENFLAEYRTTDPLVVTAVLEAIAQAGYALDDFEGGGGWNNFLAATTGAIALLER
jgi:hypothetical protein